MNITNITAAATIDGVKCCKIWHKPDGVISGLHFVYSALAFLLAALFFCILSVEHKIVEFIQNEKAGGSIGFWCPPFMCIFIGITDPATWDNFWHTFLVYLITIPWYTWY